MSGQPAEAEAVVLEAVDQALSGPGGAGVLVALSGGLDSVVLLDAVWRQARRHGWEVGAAHVDHGVRAGSDDDAAFCRRLCAERGIACQVSRLDFDPDGFSQAEARRRRYAALERAAAEYGLQTIVTAHHADDAVETALLQLRRGTSAAGLAGGVRETAGAGQPIRRPLARIGRAVLAAYADSRRLSWRDDPTNATGAYERNRLRHQVLGPLTDDGRRLAPILRTLDNLAEEADALDALAAAALRRAWYEPPDRATVALERAVLAEQPAALASRVLLQAAGRLASSAGSTGPGLDRAHLVAAVEAIGDRSVAWDQVCARGLVVSVDGPLVLLQRSRARGGRDLHEREAKAVALDSEAGELGWFGTRLRWRTTAGGPEAVAGLGGGEALVDMRRVGALAVRGPRPGDALAPVGFEGTKRVADVLAEAGVPRMLRWQWPCLVDADGELVWVVGLRRGQPGAVTTCTERLMHLRWQGPHEAVLPAVVGDALREF